MGDTILFPFSISEDNKASYLKTLQLAKEMAAKVVCFTTVSIEQKLDDAYLHLLKLNGYFQTSRNEWLPIEIPITRSIKVGTMEEELKKYLQETTIDLVICQPANKSLKENSLSEIINSNGQVPKLVTFSE